MSTQEPISISEVGGHHWRDMEELYPLYQAVTICEVKDRQTTSFWGDRWLSVGRLKECFPLLYSHAVVEHTTVAQVIRDGIESVLSRRITREAAGELEKLKGILLCVHLTTGDDRRSSSLVDGCGKLRAGPVYKSLMATTGAPASPFADFVWRNRAPPRVQFFAWLLVQERIQCRAVLVRKHVLADAECELCRHPVEDCNHIIFDCPFSTQVWSMLNVDTSGCQVSSLWNMPRPATMPAKHFNTFILLVCWQLWKHRNSVVFEKQEPSHHRFWNICKQEATLWSCRLPRADHAVADDWCNLLPPM